MKRAIALSYLLFVLMACNPTTATPTATTQAYSSTPTQHPTALPTRTPPEVDMRQSRPTATLVPTLTPFPLIPTKQALLQYGDFGGDGGDNTSVYLGRDTPQLILYTDGQLLTQQEHGSWFVQTILTTPQICSLLSRIKHTGFFNAKGDGLRSIADPIYVFDSTVQYSDGLSDYVIQVNGQPHKIVYVYPDYEPYLIQPISSALQLVRNYSPATQKTPYRAKYLMLWIERGLGNTAYLTPRPTPMPLPSPLPSLGQLLGDKNEGQAFIEDEEVAPVLKLFGNRPTGILFVEDDQEYYVIARPLLPHETPEKFSVYPRQAEEFNLPFKCQ